tara:strand:- start:528 stop:722 length:195 start_codon:yes stop_codon:yes gene_type:complete
MDVSKLNEKIRNMQKEIKKIQDECGHKDEKIEMDEKGSVKWICILCKAITSYPTQEELKNFFDK